MASSQNVSLPTKSANPEHAKNDWQASTTYTSLIEPKNKKAQPALSKILYLCCKESGAVMECDFSGHLVSFRVIGTFYVAEKCLQHLYATNKHVYTQINSTWGKKSVIDPG